MPELQFFNPRASIRCSGDRLPHWQQAGAVYFITFRLGDAVPRQLRIQWESEREAWVRVHPSPWSIDTELEYHRRFSGAIERWLDAGYGSCVLRRPECSKLMTEALLHFDGDRSIMISAIVMPNHVHALFVQNPDWPLEKIMRSWKSFTCRKINSVLARKGGLWQSDYFDRLVRDDNHLATCVRYIRNNPKKGHLRDGEFILYESELARNIK